MVNLKINGIPVQAEEGTTIIEAARHAHIDIPSLCYLKDINCIGSCRVCVVEVKGARGLVAACVYPVAEGLEVWTNTPQVRQSRRTTLELLLSEHHKKCLSCHLETAPPGDPAHIQLPIPDTIVDSWKCLLTEA